MEEQKQTGISGNALKWIAMLAMTVDHIGASLLLEAVKDGSHVSPAIFGIPAISILYYTMRLIGRIAFPLFIFELLEGVEHSTHPYRYLFRMLLFAILSEVPFDLAFWITKSEFQSGTVVEFSHQNVFMTLSLGLFALLMFRVIDGHSFNRCSIDKLDVNQQDIDRRKLSELSGMLLKALVGTFVLGAAYLLKTDYSMIGVFAILAGYLVKKITNNKMSTALVICMVLMLSSVLEITAFFSLFLIYRYNGQRGKGWKWAFYIFYPVHLLILALIKMRGIG